MPQPPTDAADVFEAAFVRLRLTLERACAVERAGAEGAGWPVQIAAAIHAGFAWAAADPAAANALTNEAMADGAAGLRRYQRLNVYVAGHLHSGREQSAEAARLPEITERALAGGLISFVAQRLDRGQAAELPRIAPEAIQFVLTPYLGAFAAGRMASASPSSEC